MTNTGHWTFGILWALGIRHSSLAGREWKCVERKTSQRYWFPQPYSFLMPAAGACRVKYSSGDISVSPTRPVPKARTPEELFLRIFGIGAASWASSMKENDDHG